MQKSTNYGLNMPDRNDQYNIDHFNQNTEAIDAMLHENSVNIGKNANDISAEAAALEAHEARRDNPHEVTKAQVGLGNVENVSTNNQTPTFTEAESLTNIESGDTLSVLFGKLRKLFSTLTGSAATSPVCPFPKGSPYVQYPTFPAPGELWPGTTWVLVDYGGAFFRAEGGKAAAFIQAGGTLRMQGQSTSVSGILGVTPSRSLSGNISVSGAYAIGRADFLVNQNNMHTTEAAAKQDRGIWSDAVVDGTMAVKDAAGADRYDGVLLRQVNFALPVKGEVSASGISVPPLQVSLSGGGSETRPDNYTKRIWRRTA